MRMRNWHVRCWMRSLPKKLKWVKSHRWKRKAVWLPWRLWVRTWSILPVLPENCLVRSDVTVSMSSLVRKGASETNISFVVEGASLRKDIECDSWFILLVRISGVEPVYLWYGTVGASLIEQIHGQQENWNRNAGWNCMWWVLPTAIKPCLRDAGIDLEHFEKNWMKKAFLLVLRHFVMRLWEWISSIRCLWITASPDIAALYKDLLSHNVSVVAANKIAASSEYDIYAELKESLASVGENLFETNVGAGLPVINTINDLINSGDKILKIKAVVSGTLNYIFNRISATTPLVETIRPGEGRRLFKNQTENWPERKGCDPETGDSGSWGGLPFESGRCGKQTLFIPDSYFEGTLDDFWRKIPQLDKEFEERRKETGKRGQALAFCGKPGRWTRQGVFEQEVDRNHPFYNRLAATILSADHRALQWISDADSGIRCRCQCDCCRCICGYNEYCNI